jgi:hypothetical protein
MSETLAPVVIRAGGMPTTKPLGEVLDHLLGRADLVDAARTERDREKCRRYYDAHAEEVRAKNRARRRERYATDPEYREKRKAYEQARRAERYANDPEYRERKLEQNRASHTRNREARNARQRERYAANPEWAQKRRAFVAAWRAAKKGAGVMTSPATSP